MPEYSSEQPILEALFACWQRLFLSNWENDQWCQHVLDDVARITQTSRAALLLFDDDQLTLVRVETIGLPQSLVATTFGDGVAGWAAEQRQPLLWSGGPDAPMFVQGLGSAALTSALSVPLAVDERLYGALFLARQSAAPPLGPQELGVALLIADQIALQLDRSRLQHTLEQQEWLTDQMMESIPSSLVVIDRNLRIVSANRNFLVKIRRQVHTTVGYPLEKIFPRVLLRHIRLDQTIREIFCTGRAVDAGKLSYRAPNIPPLVYYYRLVPLKVDGVVQHVMLLMDDITERERLGAEVRRIERRLEAQLALSSKMASLSVMAGGIAHELRNPLGIIASNAQLMEEHPDDAELRGVCVQKICTATRRAGLIIDNLLQLARPSSKGVHIVDLYCLLDETLPLLTHQLTMRQVQLVQDLAPDLPLVHGNGELLQQVFTNLILNACNAMPRGGTLTVSIRPDPGDKVEIRFSDTGCGIVPDHLTKIFDPFFTTMPIGKGTGLGLSISYSIVQHHGGTIEVASKINQGTTFTIRLPIKKTSTVGGGDD